MASGDLPDVRTTRSNAPLYWGVIVTVVLLDVVTKWLAVRHLSDYFGHVRVLGDGLRLTLVYNPGAAFGLHLGPYSRWIFLVVAVIAAAVLNRLSVTALPGDRFRQLALGLVAGGAIGNGVDRIRSSRGVVDFLDVGVGALRWPTFNVADMAVTCGAIALALSFWREDARKPSADAAPAA